MKSNIQQGKPIALITGASSGIGEATARALALHGFSVLLVARRAELLQQLVAEIEAAGGSAEACAADLNLEAETSALVEHVCQRYGRLDVLVNNAGYGPPFVFEAQDRQCMQRAFNVNVLAGMQLISELTPLWRQQGHGRVVNVSSLTRYVSAPVSATYAGTKGAMEAMTSCLRLELAPWHIQLSLVIPGFVDTPAFEKGRVEGYDKKEDPANPYRDWMRKLDDFARSNESKAISPDIVARVIVKAATAKKPAARYFVPFSSTLAAILFTILPDRMGDRMLLKMYGWGN